jgi:hypothetical protein
MRTSSCKMTPQACRRSRPRRTQADALTTDGQAVKTSYYFYPGEPIKFDGFQVFSPPESNYGSIYGFNNFGYGLHQDLAGMPYSIGKPFNDSHYWTFDAGTKAFGFDIYDPVDPEACDTPCILSTFRIEAFALGGGSLGSVTSPGNFGGLSFLGVSSDLLIGRINVTEVGSAVTSDNEFFGNYRTGTLAAEAPPALIPLPAGIVFLLAGLGVLGAMRRRPAV